MLRAVEFMWSSCGVVVESIYSTFVNIRGTVQNSAFLHTFIPTPSQSLSTAVYSFFICFSSFFHTFHTTNNNLNFYINNYL